MTQRGKDRGASAHRDKQNRTPPANRAPAPQSDARREPTRRRVIFTPGQQELANTIDASAATVVMGPAGSGKTYVAVERAIKALDAGEVTRIVLARPAVEAGEKLGYLPGDMKEKVEPYLRPLYDAFADLGRKDLLDPPPVDELPIVEICPLAFMRGRTFNGAFIILDEMHNATASQVEMATTRQGLGSKVVLTYDPTQCDLPKPPEPPVWATTLTTAVVDLIKTAKAAMFRSNKAPQTSQDSQRSLPAKAPREPDIVWAVKVLVEEGGYAHVALTEADNHRAPNVALVTKGFAKARKELTDHTPAVHHSTLLPRPPNLDAFPMPGPQS
ncbi:MAG: PhoH family protein [Alphaproteobacteria bacterium]